MQHMIARFRVLLPFTIHLRQGDTLAAQTLVTSGGPFTFYPPYRCSVQSAREDEGIRIPFDEVERQLAPASEYRDPTVQIDGMPAVGADGLRIELQRPEFDRRIVAGQSVLAEDPPVDEFFEIANLFLARLRSALQANVIKPISADQCPWIVTYLTDTGDDLQPEDGKFRRRLATVGKRSVTAINEAVWEDISPLSLKFSPPVWETLLLDSSLLLPEVGPAVVLGAAALENLVSDCLDYLSDRATLPEGLWSWINDRGDYRKEPSTVEQFDVLLKTLSGKSLKDQPELWEAFLNLKDARNSFVHQGRAMIGRKKTLVTPADALGLIAKATRIVEWVEQFLPTERRRQKTRAQIATTICQHV